jgi:hypothetical protein
LRPPFDSTALSCAAVGRPWVWMMTRTSSEGFAAGAENSGESLEAFFADRAFVCEAVEASAASGAVKEERRARRTKLAVIRRNISGGPFYICASV